MRDLPGFFVLLGLLALTSCGPAEAEGPAPGAESAPFEIGDRVQFGTAETAEWAVALTLPAEVTLPPGARHHLAPPLGGRLTSWQIALGDRLEAGDVLARITSPELADLEADLAEQSRVVRQRRQLVDRLRDPVERGLQPVQSLYDAEASAAEASARRDALAAQLAARRDAGAEEADDEMSYTWRTGAPGVIAELRSSPGAPVRPDEPILTLLDVDRAEVRVAVPERHLAQVGPETRLRWWPTGAPVDDAPIELRLSRRSPTIDRHSRTQDHYFALADDGAPGRARLIVGATGRGELMVPLTEPVVRIDADALTTIDEQPTVFVAVASERSATGAAPLQVTLIGRDGGDVLLRGEISAGDRVATRGVYLLKSIHLLAQE